MLNNPLGITEVVLRDAHQSLLATRMRVEDMLPVASDLDKVGFWSIECWGGATFDSCIRFLGEDPWERLRLLNQAMPNTPLQMLFRGQNILGYRHYADDVVHAFVERSAVNGIDVFRIFDAMNDVRNLNTAIAATVAVDKHAQGTISYTTSPVHTIDMWVEMAIKLEDMGCHSICIKDMAGLMTPLVAGQLITRIKASCAIPIALHCHATTGLSTATILKATESGVDIVDTSISAMSMTYGHTPTETVVAMLQETERDTGISLNALEELAVYFRALRLQYASLEGSLKGVDSRILLSQVPGGMLTNLESQLREQKAIERFDEVLEEIPRVRKDLGFIPLVTPTSQIVGTQAVINVLSGERYSALTKESSGVLRGEYGATPAPVNPQLQQRALDGDELMTCRPADQIEDEMERLTSELEELAVEKELTLEEGEKRIDDVLIYALFPQVGLKFLEHRDDPSQFEPHPRETQPESKPDPSLPREQATQSHCEHYHIEVDGAGFDVTVSPGKGAPKIESIEPQPGAVEAPSGAKGEPLNAPLAGNIFKVLVNPGDQVAKGMTLIVLEAMKMETEVRSPKDATVTAVEVKEGDTIESGSVLVYLA